MSHLADAALALAVFEGDPVQPHEASDAHFTMDPCVYVRLYPHNQIELNHLHLDSLRTNT